MSSLKLFVAMILYLNLADKPIFP